MRPVRATALVLVLGTLAACGQSSGDGSGSVFQPGVYTQRAAPIYRSPRQLRADQATRPQPPLASLLDKPDEAGPVRSRRENRLLAKRSDEAQARAPKKNVPKRPVVDPNLDKAKPRNRPDIAPKQKPTALKVAAIPTPKPVTTTPRPVSRPKAPAAAAIPVATPAPVPLAPRPSIASLPTLGAPRVVADGTPSALPDPSRAEAAIPIGRVPASLGAANIEARESALPVADTLERSTADETGGIGWNEAAALMRAGEVADAIDVGEYEVLLTLCSGRGVLTIQPEPGALAAVKKPEVICGKAASLTSP